MDTTTLLFALGVSIVTGLVFGLAPALQASSNQTINALKEEGTQRQRRPHDRTPAQRAGRRAGGRVPGAARRRDACSCAASSRRNRSRRASMPRTSSTASMDMFPSGYIGDRHREFQRRALEAV